MRHPPSVQAMPADGHSEHMPTACDRIATARGNQQAAAHLRSHLQVPTGSSTHGGTHSVCCPVYPATTAAATTASDGETGHTNHPSNGHHRLSTGPVVVQTRTAARTVCCLCCRQLPKCHHTGWQAALAAAMPAVGTPVEDSAAAGGC